MTAERCWGWSRSRDRGGLSGPARVAGRVRGGRGGRCRGDRRLWGRAGPVPARRVGEGHRGRPTEPAGPATARQVRSSRRGRSRASGAVGSGERDRQDRDGHVEAIRVLLVAKRSRSGGPDQGVDADPPPRVLRARRAPRSAPRRARRRAGRAASLRCDHGPTPTSWCTAPRSRCRCLGRRVLALDDELDRLDALLERRRDHAAPSSSPCTASGPTPPPRCSSPPATTPNGSGAKPPGPTSAASPRSPRPRDARPGIGSTAVATARPTTRSGGS